MATPKPHAWVKMFNGIIISVLVSPQDIDAFALTLHRKCSGKWVKEKKSVTELMKIVESWPRRSATEAPSNPKIAEYVNQDYIIKMWKHPMVTVLFDPQSLIIKITNHSDVDLEMLRNPNNNYIKAHTSHMAAVVKEVEKAMEFAAKDADLTLFGDQPVSFGALFYAALVQQGGIRNLRRITVSDYATRPSRIVLYSLLKSGPKPGDVLTGKDLDWR